MNVDGLMHAAAACGSEYEVSVAWRAWASLASEFTSADQRVSRTRAERAHRHLAAAFAAWLCHYQNLYQLAAKALSTRLLISQVLQLRLSTGWRIWTERVAELASSLTRLQNPGAALCRSRSLAKAVAAWRRLFGAPATAMPRIARQYDDWRRLWRHWMRWVVYRLAIIQIAIRLVPCTLIGLRRRLRWS